MPVVSFAHGLVCHSFVSSLPDQKSGDNKQSDDDVDDDVDDVDDDDDEDSGEDGEDGEADVADGVEEPTPVLVGHIADTNVVTHLNVAEIEVRTLRGSL